MSIGTRLVVGEPTNNNRNIRESWLLLAGSPTTRRAPIDLESWVYSVHTAHIKIDKIKLLQTSVKYEGNHNTQNLYNVVEI